jgi:hypothetical protein
MEVGPCGATKVKAMGGLGAPCGPMTPEGQEPRRFRVGHVVGTVREAPVQVTEPPTQAEGEEAPAKPLRPTSNRAPSDADTAGLLMAAVALVVFVLILFVPWFNQNGDGRDIGETRRFVVDTSIGYFDRATWMPQVLLGACVVFGLALWGVSRLPLAPEQRRGLWMAFAILLMTSGALVAIQASRLFGLVLGAIYDPGSTRLGAHIGLWLMLAAGLGIAARAYRLLATTPPGWPAWRATDVTSRAFAWGQLLVAGALGALLLSPLLPLATDVGGSGQHLSEPEVIARAHAFTIGGDSIQGAESALGVLAGCYWLVALAGLITMVAARRLMESPGRGLRSRLLHAYLLALPLGLLAVVYAFILYLSAIPEINLGFINGNDYVPIYNWIHALAAPGILYVAIQGLRQAALPARRGQDQAADDMANSG